MPPKLAYINSSAKIKNKHQSVQLKNPRANRSGSIHKAHSNNLNHTYKIMPIPKHTYSLRLKLKSYAYDHEI